MANSERSVAQCGLVVLDATSYLVPFFFSLPALFIVHTSGMRDGWESSETLHRLDGFSLTHSLIPVCWWGENIEVRRGSYLYTHSVFTPQPLPKAPSPRSRARSLYNISRYRVRNSAIAAAATASPDGPGLRLRPSLSPVGANCHLTDQPMRRRQCTCTMHTLH